MAEDTPIYDALVKEYAAKEALEALQTTKEADV